MVNYKIVMIRHGETEMNKSKVFCGWIDAPLNEKGREEALNAGKALKDANYKFDSAYSSALTRALQTLTLILDGINQTEITPEMTWRLNPKHYGYLTGLNEAQAAAKYGQERVSVWRHSFDVPPPPMTNQHFYYVDILDDPRYLIGPPDQEFPYHESTKQTMERTLPFWTNDIVPQIEEGKSILIAAHGSSLRGIVKYLDDLNDEQTMSLNIPTGIPFVYTLDEDLKPIPNGSLQFLGDPETVKKALNVG